MVTADASGETLSLELLFNRTRECSSNGLAGGDLKKVTKGAWALGCAATVHYCVSAGESCGS